MLIRRKVRDTEDVETQASIAIDAGTPANDPPKNDGSHSDENRDEQFAHGP